MPTIIDSLVVELGLDSTKFDEGQKKAIEKLRGLEDAATKHVKPTTSAVGDLVGAFKDLQGRILGIGALIAGGFGLDRLVGDIARLTAQTGYLSKSLGISAQELSAWQYAGKTVGATADDIASGITAIQNSFAQFQLHGTGPLQAFGYSFPEVGSQLYKMGTRATPTEVLTTLSEWAVKQKDPNVARYALGELGLGQGMTNLLMQGPQALQKQLEEARKNAPSQEQIRNLTELQKAFAEMSNSAEKLSRIIVSELAPAIKMFIGWIDTIIGVIQKASPEGKVQRDETESFWTRSPFGRAWRRLFPRSGGAAGAPEGGGQGMAPGAPGAVPEGSSPFLQRQRQSFTDQLQDPMVRQRVAAMAVTEGDRDPVPVIESLANRMGYVNEARARQGLPPLSVDQMLTSGFYGPITNRPWEFNAAMSRLNQDPALTARMNRAIDAVSAGSNTIGGYTDQGLRTDPNGMHFPQMSRPGFPGNIYTDWGGGPGGHAGAAAYRERLMNGVTMERALQRIPPSESPSTAPSLPSWLPGAAAANAGGGGGSFNDIWNNRALGVGARGALWRGGDSTTNNTTTSSTHIGEMNVSVPPGADPAAYAAGIRQHLQRNDPVQQSLTGMQ